MPEIIKTYRESMPAARFVGLKYGDADRINGGFGFQWGEWFDKGRFVELERRVPENWFEECGAYIGLMRYKEGEPFEYWIGMFLPADIDVPDGYASVDFPASDLGSAWLYGKDEELYGHEHDCAASCIKKGYHIIPDDNNAFWFFERYVKVRNSHPDEKGNVVLDICHYIEKLDPPDEICAKKTLAILDALHETALANGCDFREEETEMGIMRTYSLRNLVIRQINARVSLYGEYDLRAFLKLYRETGDERVRAVLFEAASPCCYCIDDKCTTLLMADARTIAWNGREKKLCGPYRHSLAFDVTEENLSA